MPNSNQLQGARFKVIHLQRAITIVRDGMASSEGRGKELEENGFGVVL